MPIFKENYCLKKVNTFAIDAKAKLYIEFNSIHTLKEIIFSEVYKRNNVFILGGGSNILLTQDFNGLILHNKITETNILEENEEFVITKVGGGVNWHDFVEWSLRHKLSGIENLSLIPGSVGASPVQNIGAYGMEVKDSITKVHTIDLGKGTTKIFSNKECQFEYRNSIFKKELKDKIIITNVEFKLSKTHLNKTYYGAIKQELKDLNLKPSPRHISRAVINIRNRKLPNPNEIANCGSFFKNPIVSNDKYKLLKKKFPEIVGYKTSKNKTKIAAGWLIEHAGFKGYRDGDAGVDQKQALVLVNYGNATGRQIMILANKIQKYIIEKYEIQLELEVNIL